MFDDKEARRTTVEKQSDTRAARHPCPLCLPATREALALSVHNLLDGFGIGARIALSPQLRAFVLIAVAAIVNLN